MHEWIIGLVVTAVVVACVPLRGPRGDTYADAPGGEADGPTVPRPDTAAARPATERAAPRRRVVRSARRRRRGGSRPANRGIARL